MDGHRAGVIKNRDASPSQRVARTLGDASVRGFRAREAGGSSASLHRRGSPRRHPAGRHLRGDAQSLSAEQSARPSWNACRGCPSDAGSQASEELELRAARVGGEGQPRVPALLPSRRGQVPHEKTMVRLGQLLEGPRFAPSSNAWFSLPSVDVWRVAARCVSIRPSSKRPFDTPAIHAFARTSPRECVVRSSGCGPWGLPRLRAFATCAEASLDACARSPMSRGDPSRATPNGGPYGDPMGDCSRSCDARSGRPSKR